jgi:hypothetical protein
MYSSLEHVLTLTMYLPVLLLPKLLHQPVMELAVQAQFCCLASI